MLVAVKSKVRLTLPFQYVSDWPTFKAKPSLPVTFIHDCQARHPVFNETMWLCSGARVAGPELDVNIFVHYFHFVNYMPYGIKGH